MQRQRDRLGESAHSAASVVPSKKLARPRRRISVPNCPLRWFDNRVKRRSSVVRPELPSRCVSESWPSYSVTGAVLGVWKVNVAQVGCELAYGDARRLRGPRVCQARRMMASITCLWPSTLLPSLAGLRADRYEQSRTTDRRHNVAWLRK